MLAAHRNYAKWAGGGEKATCTGCGTINSVSKVLIAHVWGPESNEKHPYKMTGVVAYSCNPNSGEGVTISGSWGLPDRQV